METRNVTLSLPKEILQKARRIALDRQLSLSGLLTKLLEDLVNEEDNYQLALKRQIALMKTGFDLGTQGQTTWSRDELHERYQ
ncbi:MAG: hypothetical protein PWP58_949 [Bacillota bacterium]|jgi:hypothetical protein|nr:hypothetical protein [Bacillota bacterium]MDK2785317.1 hypothetical protein [Bacillota bacterium]MDK2882613.1 hypothetical protein [Bacillota bacterium]